MTIDREIAESFQPEVKELERLLDMAVKTLKFEQESLKFFRDSADGIRLHVEATLAEIEKARNE